MLTGDLQGALLPWLERLDLAVGPLPAENPLADGDPDGFSGLSRRGTPERLLVSEWLLASEVPDEFVRRAASGEQSFLALARRSEASSRATALFFDVGPWQLGHPRLAHLALLLVMSRRARAAGASFFWGTLQGGNEGIFRSSLQTLDGRLLLATRARQNPTREDLLAALSRPPLLHARRECWVVGGATACALASGPCIEIEEPLEEPLSRLVVRVRRFDGTTARIELPLMPEALRLRLLRDPFPVNPPRRKVSRKVELGPRASLFFSDSARRLMVGLVDGRMLAYPLPNSPYLSTPGEPALLAPERGAELLAAGWERNQGLLLLRKDQRFWARWVGRKGGTARPDQPLDAPDLAWTPEAPVSPLLTLPLPGGERACAAMSPRNQLVLFAPKKPAVIEDDVLAMATLDRRLILAWYDPSSQSLSFKVEDATLGEEARRLKTCSLPHPGAVFFGHADASPRHPALHLVAVERRSEGEWLLISSSDLPLASPRDGTVVGVFSDKKGPALLLLPPERDRLLLYGDSGVSTILKTGAPIVRVAASQAAPLLAYLTEEGEIGVFSGRFTQLLLRVRHG